ncbi:MAG: methylmalonyl Co-A mutase-associated GTPase MeaB [Acidimicrobiales bacterium]
MSALLDPLRAGDRRALARAITLVESTRPEDREEAAVLLEAVLPHTGRAVRVGISGTPGVGKSTFVDALGRRLTGAGRTLAVLAVDPSSTVSGGSILGDKTRMGGLATSPHAYIRPSPAGGTLGGVARRTREALLLCEAAGFDVVLVETVGVGQSEVAVAGMVDTFVLLLAPGGGDDLQGIKRGVMELADLVVVNKADGDLLGAARQAAADHVHGLHLQRPRSAAWTPEVLLCSATSGDGVDEVWAAVERHRAALVAAGELERLRQLQARQWLWSDVTDRVVAAVRAAPGATAAEADVAAGRVPPSVAAARLADAMLGRTGVEAPTT